MIPKKKIKTFFYNLSTRTTHLFFFTQLHIPSYPFFVSFPFLNQQKNKTENLKKKTFSLFPAHRFILCSFFLSFLSFLSFIFFLFSLLFKKQKTKRAHARKNQRNKIRKNRQTADFRLFPTHFIFLEKAQFPNLSSTVSSYYWY